MNTINISPDYRVNVEYDDGPQEPILDRYDTVFYEVESCNNLDIHEGDADIIAALEGIEEAVNGYAYTGPRSVSRALIKHLERHGYKSVMHTFPGQCPSDWNTAVVGVKTDGIELDGAISDWARWYDNEYYALTLERRHVWHDADGATLETWDTVDTLGGVELDDAYDADEIKRVAGWYFDVEEAA